MDASVPSASRSKLERVRDVELLEARLAVLTQFLGGIVFEVDSEGRYVEIWTAAPELLSRRAEELLGRSIGEFMGEEAAAPFVATFRRVMADGVPESFDYSLDVPAGRRQFRCDVRRTDAPPGRDVATVTLLVRDVTAEAELRAKLLEAERLAAMGLVAASVCHEIKQPLAFATTSVEILARELASSGNTGERSSAALADVREAIQRLADIAANVGVVAPRDHHDATTDLKRPTLAAVDLCASELRGRGRVRVDVDDLPRVALREGELCQVITNLLLNAAHAVEPSRAAMNEIHITGAVVSEGMLCLSVADNGRGIAPAHVGRVFEPFFTTKEPGRGTGLGLFASRRIVENAGGKLEVESRLGLGTVAKVTLPIAGQATSAEAASSSARRHSVLVVDDDASFLRSLKLLLEDTHDVVVADRSEDALEFLRATPARFDAVLCDLSMPNVDGVSFYEWMADLGIADRFVLMTAGAFTARGESFVRRTDCPRIAKPFTPDALTRVIARVATR
jgi:signal transduction histidine kinase/CheY-like chemotaxis protein